jgi:hypothetical protein
MLSSSGASALSKLEETGNRIITEELYLPGYSVV